MIFESQNRKSRKYIELSLHLLVWGLAINIPLLSDHPPESLREYGRMLILPLSFAIVFYANYFYFIHRFLFAKNMLAFFAANIILYAVCITSIEQIRKVIMKEAVDTHERRGPSTAEFILGTIIAFAMTTGVSVAIRTTNQWFKSEEQRKELESEHLKSELLNLKNQLNPHFFFNTLNNIYGLIDLNQQKAQEAIHQLSKLMRYHLYDSNEKFVPVSKEIEFLHHYIDLMRLRLTPNVSVSYHFPEDTGSLTVAPLLFISLIENSFKHGINLNKPSEIFMEMQIIAPRQLTFHIKNTSFPKSENDRSGSGIGLGNLKKRLALLYPDRHLLNIQTSEKYFECTLTLQL